MGNNYFDYTENYNFSKELNFRKNFPTGGEVIGEIGLDNGFFAELEKNGGIAGASDRIIVWLCHREHKEKVYAFTAMRGIMLCGVDTQFRNAVRMKFKTNYAKLIKAYANRYCRTEKKVTKGVSVKD